MLAPELIIADFEPSSKAAVERMSSSGNPMEITVMVRANMAEPALMEALFEVLYSHAFSQMTERQKMHCVEHVLKSVQDRAADKDLETYKFSTGGPIDLGPAKAKEPF